MKDAVIIIIESICSQFFLNFELFLVDNGSNDNRTKICEEYQ